MKTLRILILIFITAISSCNNDEAEINQGDELLGHWQSIDVSEYPIILMDLMPDNRGGYGVNIHAKGHETNWYYTIYWTTTDNPKTLIIRDDFDPNSREIINSSYYINADGQLFLSCFKDLPFIKNE